MQNCRIEWTLIVVMSFLLIGCSKDIESSGSEKILNEDKTRIVSFINWINGNTLELRDKPDDIDPGDFLNDLRDAINYEYAEPFDLYWETEMYKDTISIVLSNCLIPYTNASAVFDTIFSKVKCNTKCSNLYNNKLMFVNTNATVLNCSELQIEVLTVTGTTQISGNAGEDEPDPAELPSYKRRFTASLMALTGTCTDFNDPISAPVEMGKKTTWNVVGAAEADHTVINLQSIVMWPDIWYGSNQIEWWIARCRYDTEENQCPNVYEVQCDVWFNSSGGYTQAGMDKYCLEPATLNSYLDYTESFCENLATSYNKKFVNLNMDWGAGLCGYGINQFWHGTLLIGNKIYRPTPSQLPADGCDCI